MQKKFTMNKNTIIGLVLIFALFIGFSYLQSPSKEEIAKKQKHQDSLIKVEKEKRLLSDSLSKIDSLNLILSDSIKKDSIVKVNPQALINIDKSVVGAFEINKDDSSDYFTFENNNIKVVLSTLGGRIYSAELKDMKTFNNQPLVLFSGEKNNFGFSFFSNKQLVESNKLTFKPFWLTSKYNNQKNIKLGANDSILFSLRCYPVGDSNIVNENSYIEYLYTLKSEGFTIGVKLNLVNMDSYIDQNTTSIDLKWSSEISKLEKSFSNENMSTTVYYKDNEEVDYLSETKNDTKDITTQLKWISFKQQFFAQTLIAKSNFESAKITSELITNDSNIIKSLEADIKIPITTLKDFSFGMDFYFGPTKYKILKSYDLDLERQIPLGWSFAPMAWINRFAVIPVFNWLESYGMNYGIIILILTIILKTVLFPIAYKTYLSSARMRILKPEVEEISKRYPKTEDALKKQQATMALYKQAGASPLSGCLPMLLQLPILLAMFRFFPSSFELRQQPFLWADDLSSYDSVLDLGFSIPFYGDHVSLFTILMTIATLIYTYLNSNMMGGSTQQMKSMKIMMYVMPVMFLGIFNNYASGLSYYYFLVNCITFLQMWLFRIAINEKKIHAKIQMNKLKPVKKSSWAQKLENIAKQQQEIKKRKR